MACSSASASASTSLQSRPEDARQEQLDEPVAADDAAGLGGPAVGEAAAVADLVAIRPASASRLSMPVTDGARTPSRSAISAGETMRSAPPEAVNRLEIILHGRGHAFLHGAPQSGGSPGHRVIVQASAGTAQPRSAAPRVTAHVSHSARPKLIRSPTWIVTHQSV